MRVGLRSGFGLAKLLGAGDKPFGERIHLTRRPLGIPVWRAGLRIVVCLYLHLLAGEFGHRYA